MTKIHATAIIDKHAAIASDVTVGAYAVIGADVIIKSGSTIAHHANITGPTTIGCNNHIYPFASIGGDPSHNGFDGNKASLLTIGDNNKIQEYVTIHRSFKEPATLIGNNNWLMPYVHVGHDSQLGDHNILTNQVALSGHVSIGNHVTIGGGAGVVQFCQLGDFVFVAGMVRIGLNVPSYIAVNDKGKVATINKVGLKRNGVSDASINILQQAFKILYRKGLLLKEAQAELQQLYHQTNDKYLQNFMQSLKQLAPKILR